MPDNHPSPPPNWLGQPYPPPLSLEVGVPGRQPDHSKLTAQLIVHDVEGVALFHPTQCPNLPSQENSSRAASPGAASAMHGREAILVEGVLS